MSNPKKSVAVAEATTVRPVFDAGGRKTGKKPRRVEFPRPGNRKAPYYRCFPVWVEGKLLEVPLLSCRRDGRTWVVSGKLKTETGVWEVEDVLQPRGNTVVVSRGWQYRGKRVWGVRLGLDLMVPFGKLDFWAVPYASMNGNAGSRIVPRGMTCKGKPWTFREERTTAPGLLTVEADGFTAGSYAAPSRSDRERCASSVVPERQGYLLRTFFPFKETPYTFLGAAFPGRKGGGLYTAPDGLWNSLVLEGEARFRRKFFVVFDQVSERRHGWVKVWESAWRNLRAPLAEPPEKDIVRRLWRAVDYHWVEKDGACGYSLRLDHNGDPFGSFTPVFSAGWGGPTMMLAWLGLRRAIKARRPQLAEKPLRAAEFFTENAGLKSGAFLTRFNLKKMAWDDNEQNAVQMGGAAYWLLKCVELLRGTKLFTKRLKADKWADFALRFCDLAVHTQRPDGAFGSHWTLEGRCLGSERTMGVHAARAVLEAGRLTGKEKYLRAAEAGAAYFIKTCVNRETGYGDCTDLASYTTENDGAGVPDFLLDLYRATGKKLYLNKAVRAAEYCLPFIFTYNVRFASETECGRRGVRTRGFAAISPETAFVCWWFTLQANLFLELGQETGEARWEEYAAALIRSSLQMRTKRGDTFGLASRLIGCRAEVLPVCDTVKGPHFWKAGMSGYSWHEPVWWPAAFNLLNFAFIEDRFPEFRRKLER